MIEFRALRLWTLFCLLGLAGCAGEAGLAERPSFKSASAASGTPGETLYSATLDCRSPEAPQLAERFAAVSRLAAMRDQPASLAALEQRLAVSLTEAESLLRNQGYYEGRVSGRLGRPSGGSVAAEVTFVPGPRYTFGPARITLARPLPAAAAKPPLSLSEVGLDEGSPAAADDMLKAVERLAAAWRDRGFPEAGVQKARYFVDRPARRLEAEITLDPGPFARLGPVQAAGGSPVDQAYLDALKPWADGQPWNQSLVEDYLTALRQTGLFQSVDLADPDEGGTEETRPVRLKLAGAAPRTVGGQISYDTDFGPGVKAYWEHRNLSGRGDRLRLDLPVWGDLQEFTASYRYPFIRRPDQDFIARAGLLRQHTDAYRLWSGAVSAGLERRLSRRWRASLTGYAEGGSLEDPERPETKFLFFGLPAALNYDQTDDPLNPTRGAKLNLAAAPYAGSYHDSFQVLRSRLEAQSYLPLGTSGASLALRGLWGGLWGVDDSRSVPSSLRFYSGGGGSVRGYDYQSVGPRNAQNDPLGGLSQVELSSELRLRFSETLGAAAFIDGGMVYASATDRLFQDLLWGAGLGFRYFTSVGPVRLDVALPMDRRPGDSPWQLYLSLGQSF